MKQRRHMQMAAKKQNLYVRASSCAGSGALYEKPVSGQSVDSSKQTTLQWNPSCLDPSGGEIDIYLYAPQEATANLPIHAWTRVPATTGSFDIKLAPKWWNATNSVELSLNIVPSGNQPWDTANPFGPTFTATYAAPTDGSKPPADAIVGTENKLISIFYKGGHITDGGKAAAVICPLLVLFILIGIYVRKLHINRNNKTADWAEHMDKRMSQISVDWQAGGDGSAGPVPGSRPASFMAQRPNSSYRPSLDQVRALYNANLSNGNGSETNLAGMGSSASAGDIAGQEMSEQGTTGRPSESMFSAYRQSRVSFAPSSEGVSHARVHKASSSIPRIGSALRNSSMRDSQMSVPKIDPRFKTQSQLRNTDEDEDDEYIMSPTQEQGAKPIDIDDDTRNSIMAYPALEMVTQNGSEFHGARPASTFTTGADSAYAPDAMVPEEEYQMQNNGSSNSHNLTVPMHQGAHMLPPSNNASPDEALRQYAAQRSQSSMGNNTMRTLYTPTSDIGHE